MWKIDLHVYIPQQNNIKEATIDSLVDLIDKLIKASNGQPNAMIANQLLFLQNALNDLGYVRDAAYLDNNTSFVNNWSQLSRAISNRSDSIHGITIGVFLRQLQDIIKRKKI